MAILQGWVTAHAQQRFPVRIPCPGWRIIDAGARTGFPRRRRLGVQGVNVWSKVLTANEIDVLSKSCKAEKAGNVYKWEDFLYALKATPRLLFHLPVSLDSLLSCWGRMP